jgi:hypothetical protein
MRNARKLGIGILGIALICACASAPKGPTDEELVAQLVQSWQQAIIDKDLDASMAITSESFSNSEAADKAMWKSYLEWIIASGYLDGAEADASGAETTIEEGKATVGPIVLSTAAGVFNMELTLAKEEAGWMVVSSEAR